ncbi:Na+/H+ antiporter NhaA [Cellulomonas sp. SG140]|uniref:Na+/H+ antiporter NhaA n=1 Tax=Cellulomonas sp. SG140 TaxID=2976536 RepID=UPI0021E8B30A|nr:Na+/H+ antiporter NhaA [Cellulomonas sp. SG140]
MPGSLVGVLLPTPEVPVPPRRDNHRPTPQGVPTGPVAAGRPPREHRRLFAALTPGGERNLLDTLRDERTGAVLLLVATALALGWAQLWPAAYRSAWATAVGPAAVHLHLTLGQWATDGLLAVFFFVVGLELKRELVTGELRRPATAVVPAVAAVGGMAVPALVYLAVNLTSADGRPVGWAVPTATDIAFAVGVLSLVGRSLPASLRAFLLTLAVVDDLLAIVVIAVFYARSLSVLPLLGALGTVALFAVLARRTRPPVWLLLPLALTAWALLHASGVHATIAGVLLGLSAPTSTPVGAAPGTASTAERWEHRWRPLSAGVAVPVFALAAAGVTVSGDVLRAASHDPVALGVAAGLVLGKPLGILAATWAVARFTRASLAPALGWADVLGVGLVGGIGFTVSLLVGGLAFGSGSPQDEHVVVAVLAASAVAALLGGSTLAWRDRVHRGRRRSVSG